MSKTTPLRQVQRRFGTRALTVAIALALVMILGGYKALGKGLLLGTLFSILNFILMAEFLPLRLTADGRRRASAIALATLLLRYALLAVPLIVAAKTATFAFSTAAVGLFMVPLVALVDGITTPAAANHPPH